MNICTKKIKACEIEVSGSAFAYERPSTLPKLHCVGLYIGKRGSGKNLAATALLEKLKFHRIFVITPLESFLSNKVQMDRLGIQEEDVFDCDDACAVDKVMSAMNEERDVWEKWKEDMKRYKRFMSYLASHTVPIESLPIHILSEFYDMTTNDFSPPKHKYGGERPCCAARCSKNLVCDHPVLRACP